MNTAIRKFAVDLRIRIGYGTAFLLLLMSYLLTLFANSELLKQARLVDHSNKIIIHLESVMSSLKDAETGMRGYLLVKDKAFLQPYDSSKSVVDSILRLLQHETLDNQDQQTSLNSLRTLIDKKYQIMDLTVEGFSRQHYEMTDLLLLKSFFGKEIMDRIRTTVNEVQFREQVLLKERSKEMNTRYNTLNTIIYTSIALAFLMAIYGFYNYSRENRARREADEKVFQYQEQLKEQINALDKANKELIQMRSIEKFAATGRIARTIAHEIRNPLTNVNLAVDQLKNDLTTEPENAEIMLDMINRNSDRINQLITDLLRSTKFTDLTYKKVSINQILDETLELAMDRITLKNITVTRNYSEDICDVSVDVEKIKIAFLNIIVNAIEAMEPGTGILQIKTTNKDGKCLTIISDNGRGIEPESLSKIFEPYFTKKPKGTGLGLTHTQNIILNHDGLISLESEAGKGTTFTITLNFA